MKHQTTRSTIFELSGVPALNQAFPLALQHVVAMIVGCVTPAIIVSGVAGLSEADSVILIQAALVTSALATFVYKLFPIYQDPVSYNRIRPSGHHGHQLCLCSEYAVHCRRV